MRKIVILLLITAFLFIMAATGYYYWKRIETNTLTATDRRHTSGRYIKLKAGITHYELAGPVNGQAVLLISGFATPSFLTDSTFNYLVKQGFRVLRYDQFGRGYSDRPDVEYTTDLYLDQIKELLQRLKLRTPIHVMGLSFGGRIAMDMAGTYPSLVNKVILADSGFGSMKPRRPEWFTWYKMATHLPELAAGQLADYKYPQRYPDWVARCSRQMQFKGYTHALVSTMYHYNMNMAASLQRLNRSRKPVMLIWGEEDKSTPLAMSDSIRRYLRTEFFLVPDAGHLPATEQSGLVNKKIADFLKL